MAKRKTKKVQLSRSQLMQKRRGRLDKEFLCYYCQNEKSVAVKIDNQSGVGLLSCRICGVKFSTRVTVLDEAIDVYSLWMDSCRESQQLDATSLRTNGETNRGENHGIESKTQVRSTAATVKHSPQTSDIPVVKGGGTPEVLGSQTKTNEHLPKHKFVDEVSSTVFSGISGGNRSKRIIDATEETGTVPAFTVDTLKGESLFDDD